MTPIHPCAALVQAHLQEVAEAFARDAGRWDPSRRRDDRRIGRPWRGDHRARIAGADELLISRHAVRGPRRRALLVGHARSLFCRGLLIAVAVAAIVLADPAAATAAPPLGNLSPAELWVLEQIASGEMANLPERFPDERDRTLRASYLEELLTGTVNGTAVHGHGVRIVGAVIEEPLDLVRADVPHYVSLGACRFASEVNLSESHFRKGLSLNTSEFARPLQVRGATVDGDFQLTGARLRASSPAAPNDFSSVKVGRNLYLAEAEVGGPTSFAYTRVEGSLVAGRARFTFGGDADAGDAVDFGGLRVGSNVFLDEATFVGGVNFNSAAIGYNLYANGATFGSPARGVRLNGMEVGHSVFLQRAIVAGPATLDFAEATHLFAENAQFLRDVSMDSMTIHKDIQATGTHFHGNADFDYVEASYVSLHSAQFLDPTAEVSFRYMRVGGNLFLDQVHFAGSADLSDLTVGGLLSFEGIRPEGWPKRLTLDDLMFEDIKADGSPFTPLGVLDSASLDTAAYKTLEAHYGAQGQTDAAKEVYTRRKARETERHLQNGRLLDAFGNGFAHRTVNYGRDPQWAFLWGLAVVVVGWVVFWWHGGVVPATKAAPPVATQAGALPDHRPLLGPLYSLDLFIPAINLGVADAWEPKGERRGRVWLYMRLHKALGWVLIPIGIAAITGFF